MWCYFNKVKDFLSHARDNYLIKVDQFAKWLYCIE